MKWLPSLWTYATDAVSRPPTARSMPMEYSSVRGARISGLNRKLTAQLTEAGWKVLSPLEDEKFRSAETLVAVENPANVVSHLAQHNILVTEKPQGIRVATDFFNNEDDIEILIRNLSV